MAKSKLAELRENKGLSQGELAEELGGVSQQLVSAWEKGVRKPSPDRMQQLEDFFETDKEIIFFDLFNYKMLLKERKS